MTKQTKVSFVKAEAPAGGVIVLLAGADLALGAVATGLLEGLSGGLERAAKIAGFTGKASTTLDLIAPAGIDADRVMVFGLGDSEQLSEQDWLKLGGAVQAGLAAAKAKKAALVFDASGAEMESAAAIAMPEIRPPPPTGTTMHSRSGQVSSISSAKVPCPAITRGSS